MAPERVTTYLITVLSYTIVYEYLSTYSFHKEIEILYSLIQTEIWSTFKEQNINLLESL